MYKITFIVNNTIKVIFMNVVNIKNMCVKRHVIEVIEVILGAALMAVATSFFLLPNQLSSGGFSGIATILYYLFNLPMGITILVLNIPLFILALFKLGKGFIAKAILGTFAFSAFIDIFDKLNPLTQDRFLACIYGGIIMGIGTALILRANASTGGSDLISLIIREYNSKYRTATLITVIDIIIVTLNVFFFKKIEIGLYSAIAIYLMGKIIDVIFEGIYFTKLVFIISDKSEEISKRIGENIKRGVTGLHGKGMYTSQDKLVLMCAATRGDVTRVRQTALIVDPKAFIIITNAREVFGKGFKIE